MNQSQNRGEISLALSVTALILSFPANFLPFMQLELYGQMQKSTIWQGVVSLYDSGEWFVAAVVFAASLVIPIMKIGSLIYLSVRATQSDHLSPHDMHLHRIVEVLGRWSMLDIFLVAILVAMLKFGNLAQVSIQPGAIYFLFVVILTMVASEVLARGRWKSEVAA